MNLLEVRQKFIKFSGRADLAKTDVVLNDTDTGADFFIQGASIDLDLEQDHIHTEASFERALAIDEYDLDLKHCRVVNAVYFEDSDEELVKLDKLTYEGLIKKYPELGSTDSRTPAHYAVQPIRRAPQQVGAGDSVELVSVVVLPPTDTATTITVHGEFFSYPLEINTDENYWSLNFPHILVLATLRHMEGFYRNTQGYNDMDKLVKERLMGLDKDLANWSTIDNLNIKG